MQKIIGIVIVVLALCGVSQATVVLRSSVESMVQESDLVVLGHIVDVKTVLIDGQPWTNGTFLVEKSMKGNVRGYVYFRIPGGMQQINGRTLVTRAEGAPELNPTEKAVIFLNGNTAEYSSLVGWGHGYWKVQNIDGKEYVRASDSEDNSVTSLESFMNRVRTADTKK